MSPTINRHSFRVECQFRTNRKWIQRRLFPYFHAQRQKILRETRNSSWNYHIWEHARQFRRQSVFNPFDRSRRRECVPKCVRNFSPDVHIKSRIQCWSGPGHNFTITQTAIIRIFHPFLTDSPDTFQSAQIAGVHEQGNPFWRLENLENRHFFEF
jgi:hypothetical protein